MEYFTEMFYCIGRYFRSNFKLTAPRRWHGKDTMAVDVRQFNAQKLQHTAVYERFMLPRAFVDFIGRYFCRNRTFLQLLVGTSYSFTSKHKNDTCTLTEMIQ